MLSFSQIVTGSILLQIVSGSNLVRINKRDATTDLIPTPCVKTCNLAQTGFATCMAATPPGFNASTDIAADLAYLKCSCTDPIALNTGSCTSCISTLLVNNTIALANQNVSILIDGSFLSAFNYGCQAYGKVSNLTWTNATYTTSGGFDGNGTKIEAFNATLPVTSTSSSVPVATSTSAASAVNGSTIVAGTTMVPIASASASAAAASAKPTSASSKSIVNLTGLGLTLLAGLTILTL